MSATLGRERVNQIAIFVIALLCYVYFFPRWADPNQNSRLDMVVAVVEDGTFQIDKYVANTVDYAKVGEHYYSDKAPGAAFFGVPIYAGLRLVLGLPVVDQLTEQLGDSEAFKATLRESGSGVLKDKVRFALAQVALSFLTNAVPTALLCVLMYRLSARFGASQGARAFVALGYGLLTPAFAYANAFYGHQLSAALLFAAFYLTFKFDRQDVAVWSAMHYGHGADGTSVPSGARRARPSCAEMLTIGLLLGYSVVTEFPALLIAGILTLYAFYVLGRRGEWKVSAWVLIGLAIPAVLLLSYNTTVFGGPFKLGYSNSELWQAQHQAGFMSLTLPHAEAVWGITFSPFRGLFVLSPIILLALPGFVLWWRSRRARPAFWVASLSIFAMFLFNSSSIMWWGGFAIGPRYVLPGLPFMALTVVFVLDPAIARPGVQIADAARAHHPPAWLPLTIVALSVWSLVATWGLTLADQAFPSDAIRNNPLLEYALPNWMAGDVARNIGTLLGLKGASSLLPLLVVIVLVGIVWRWTTPARNVQSSTQPERPEMVGRLLER